MSTLSQPICLRQPILRPVCVRSIVARSVLKSVCRHVPVDVLMPDGELLGQPKGRPTSGPTDRPVLEIVRPTALFERLAHHPKIGIGEAYMAGDWRAGPGTDLAELLLPFAERLTTAVPATLQRLRASPTGASRSTQNNSLIGRAQQHRGPLRPEQRPVRRLPRPDDELQLRRCSTTTSPCGAQTGSRRRSCARSTRSSTSPRYGRHPRPRDRHRLGHARHPGSPTRRPGHHASPSRRSRLRWPAERVGRRRLPTASTSGCRTTARSRATTTPIVSVEMIEAVGEEYWPTYFATLDRAPRARAASRRSRRSSWRTTGSSRPGSSYGWIQKHIFPGGIIPSLQAIEDTTDRRTRRCGSPDGASFGAALRRDPAPCGARRFTDAVAADPGARASTRRSAACGSSTSPTARPASAAGYLDVASSGSTPAGAGMSADRHHRGQRFWVVGASSGIGAALARELVAAARSVAISARRAEELGEVSGGRHARRAARCHRSPTPSRPPPREVTEALGGHRPRRAGAPATGSSSTPPDWDRRGLRPARRGQPRSASTTSSRPSSRHAAAGSGPHRRHRVRRRLPRARRLGGLRRDEGRADQPARGAASVPVTHMGSA